MSHIQSRHRFHSLSYSRLTNCYNLTEVRIWLPHSCTCNYSRNALSPYTSLSPYLPFHKTEEVSVGSPPPCGAGDRISPLYPMSYKVTNGFFVFFYSFFFFIITIIITGQNKYEDYVLALNMVIDADRSYNHHSLTHCGSLLLRHSTTMCARHNICLNW